MRLLCAVFVAALCGTAAAEAVSLRGAGREAYLANCAACHLENGHGVPSAFPPLDARVGRWAMTEAGRDYLVSVVSNGLFGPVDVNGTRYVGAMPAMTHLGADVIAGILDYVVVEFGLIDAGRFSGAGVEAIQQRLGAAQSRSLRPDT